MKLHCEYQCPGQTGHTTADSESNFFGLIYSSKMVEYCNFSRKHDFFYFCSSFASTGESTSSLGSNMLTGVTVMPQRMCHYVIEILYNEHYVLD